MAEKQTLEEQPAVEYKPTPASEQEIERTEVAAAPSRSGRRRTIQVQLKYGGRRKPIPVEFPEDAADRGA